MGGRGVPALVRLSGEAPASGEILVFRARLSPTEPAAAERIMADAVEDLSAFTPPGWRGLVHRLRKGLAQRAEPLLAGIAVGDTSGVSPGLDAALKTTSLTHITAVSGAHVAIVLGLALGLAALSGAPPWGSALAGGLTLAAFTALIGPSPSVLRAVLMGAATVAGLAAGKNRLALGALAAAVAVVLAANPWMARSFGLILSALSTAALIVAAPPLARWLRRAAPGLPRPVAEAAALTASAQLVCAPVIAVFAGQISLAALPANLAAAPAVPVATVFGLAALALAPLWPNGADGAAAVGNWAARWIAWIANSLDAQPAAAIAWPSGAGGLVTASAATLALAALAWWVRRAPPKARRTTLMAALAAGLAGALVAGPLRGPLRQALGRGPPTDWLVAACDVGQGTAVAVRSGPAAAVLIDAGPADGGVGRCLDDLAVTRLDAVILTHFHADHVGGLAEAVAGREWSSLVHGAPCGETAAAMRVSHIASRSGVERLEIGPDGPVATGQVGGLPVRVHPSPLTAACPSGPSDGEESAVNNAGLTVRLETAGVAVWALGDLEREGQDALLAQAGQSRPDGIAHRQATVVIVAHHGSANQSEALAGALAADVAVISVGQDNRYGHPTPQTIALYSRHGQIRRTDQDGLVALRRADLPGGG
jgi:competence protein ComEC